VFHKAGELDSEEGLFSMMLDMKLFLYKDIYRIKFVVFTEQNINPSITKICKYVNYCKLMHSPVEE
jgi:hypothetical protein